MVPVLLRWIVGSETEDGEKQWGPFNMSPPHRPIIGFIARQEKYGRHLLPEDVLTTIRPDNSVTLITLYYCHVLLLSWH